MGWLDKLYRTYDNNLKHIGDPNDSVPLLPIAHTLQNAQLTIRLDSSSAFLGASIIPKANAKTIVPATEDSAGRTGKKPVPHPLCDKLQYIAGDYLRFGGEVTSGYAGNPSEPHHLYLRQLNDWCSSPFKHPKVLGVLAYVKKGTVVTDLVGAGIFPVDGHGQLPKTRPGRGEKGAEIFRTLPANALPEDAFVRWRVEVPNDPQSDLWTDPAVWESWADYQASLQSSSGLCYVTGRETFLASNHPKRIRHGADGAKLISSNDNADYTFRGRFTSAREVYGIGFEVTQKAHSALRWLIARQGYRDDSRAFVAWAASGAEIPDPFLDTASLISRNPGSVPASLAGDTAQGMGNRLSSLIRGYSVKLGNTDDVVVMGLDSAVPGRLAITFYREITGSEFLERVMAWHDPHQGCTWVQNFGREKRFFGAPAPKDIAEAAYGTRLDDRLRRATTERLLPCITDGAPIPRDLVESCARRASYRSGSRTGSNEAQSQYWEWEKGLGIACALVRYYYKERGYSVALDPSRATRDYLYGRLLALAEHLEGRALYVAGESRETNAARLMQRFADHPYSTWLTIEKSLAPYKQRLRANRAGLLITLEKHTDAVFDLFQTDDFRSDQPLTGEFLLGYHCQRSALRPGKSNSDEPEVDQENDSQNRDEGGA